MSASQSALTNRSSVSVASDDEILGLNVLVAHGDDPNSVATRGRPARMTEDPMPARSNDKPGTQGEETSTSSAADSVNVPRADEAETNRANAEPENYRHIFDANPELREAWNAANSYREIFPDVEQARSIQKLFPTAADAERAAAEVAELDRIDAMFLSNRPESLAELAATIYRLNPESFEGLARVMSGMLRSGIAAPVQSATRMESGSAFQNPTPERSAASTEAGLSSTKSGPSAEQVFLAATNAAAVRGVMEAIEGQVDRLLPQGITPGARNRVIGEIYRELDGTLTSNRGLTRQLREAIHSRVPDAQRQETIAGLLIGRARQALPSVAKKVIGEWTSSVLAASSERLARQRAGERRVDIANAGPAASEVRRPLAPSDINYAKLSDADILNL